MDSLKPIENNTQDSSQADVVNTDNKPDEVKKPIKERLYDKIPVSLNTMNIVIAVIVGLLILSIVLGIVL